LQPAVFSEMITLQIEITCAVGHSVGVQIALVYKQQGWARFLSMNNGPNIVEQYVFVCNIGCENVQNCPEIFKFLCTDFLLLSGWPDCVDGARLLVAQEVARGLYIAMMDYASWTAGCLKKRIMFVRCLS
jgi:hypothetical protein